MDVLKTPEEVTAFIEQNFVTNPIGIELDVEKLQQAYLGGATFEDIAQRSYQGEFSPPEGVS